MHDPLVAGLRDRLTVAPEVADALRAGRPVVALESTLISHGLPFPRNLEVAGAAEAAVRESGAVPATVGIRDGRLVVGLDAPALVELATAHGKKGYPAEDVADDALDALEDFLEAAVPVGEHLADQLLLPLAVAGGGRFRCDDLSLHASTNIETIHAFLDVPIRTEKHPGGVDVIIGRCPAYVPLLCPQT